jgi:hypothetical protein
MSTSEPQAHLTVRGAPSTLEIELVDSNFASVASSVGPLEVGLQPGIYEIRFREGTEHAEQLLKVEPGPLFLDAPQFARASPAPVERTKTSHEYHEQPVVEACAKIQRDCAGPGPETGGIVVMVRNVRGQDELAFPMDLDTLISVTDNKLASIGRSDEQWHLDPDAGWALWRSALKPGGYTLRTAAGDDEGEVLHQALWVEQGWQTLVFIPNTPDGPAPELATIHIVRVGEWVPWDDGSGSALALESVLAGLREGRPIVPSDLDQLFYAKFVNPFLGIAAAHALLLESRPSSRRLNTVIGNLEQLLPESPDVAALAYRARAAGAKRDVRRSVHWPPLFYVGYRALVRADAAEPGVLADGSSACAIAAQLRVAGLFTTWVEPTKRPTPRGVARDIGDRIGLTTEPTNPGTERVRTYVASAARIEKTTPEKILDRRSTKQLALATGLPTATVREAVKQLEEGNR